MTIFMRGGRFLLYYGNMDKHCKRYYVTNATGKRITSQQIVKEYRDRWKIEVLFRNLKQLFLQQKFIGIKHNGNKTLRLLAA